MTGPTTDSAEPHIQISLIIPAYNEEKYITPTLESVTRARRKFERVSGKGVEIIVVDNASTDRTGDIAREFGCTVVPFEKHQIAAVRNAGARAARGEYLVFVDADKSIVPEDLFLEIDKALSDQRIYGGAARFRPERWNVRILAAVMLVQVIAALLRISAVLFYIRRVDFDALGGWNEKMYAAEDVDFALRMKRAARASGRRFRILRSRITICVRKFDLLPPLALARVALRFLMRPSLRRPDHFHDIFYDGRRLR